MLKTWRRLLREAERRARAAKAATIALPNLAAAVEVGTRCKSDAVVGVEPIES